MGIRSKVFEIDYSDIIDEMSDDELREELVRRGIDCGPSVTAIYEAMALGKKDEAYALMREYVQQETGRILP